MNRAGPELTGTMPSSATPEAILEHTCERVIKIDANIIAYFADYFHALRQGLNVIPATSAHTAQSDTASAHNRS